MSDRTEDDRMSNFDFEAFVDGYIEAALWADCMPQSLGDFLRALGLPSAADDADEGVSQEVIARRLREIGEYSAAVEVEGYSDEIGGGEHLELRPGAREEMIERGQLREFVSDNSEDLAAYCEQRVYDPSQGPIESYAGHDFWLTRQGHGTGFWDRGLGELGERLTAAARAYGSADDHTPWDCGDGTAEV